MSSGGVSGRDRNCEPRRTVDRRILARGMKALALVLVLGLVPPSLSAGPVTNSPLWAACRIVRDPGNLPFLELREDGSFRVGASREPLDRAPLLAGTWAFADHHLMLVVPEGGCASAPRLERMVVVFVELQGALYPAMSSTATQAVVVGNPQVGCTAYDGASIELYRPVEAGAALPVGVWQGHRVPGLFCTGAKNVKR